MTTQPLVKRQEFSTCLPCMEAKEAMVEMEEILKFTVTSILVPKVIALMELRFKVLEEAVVKPDQSRQMLLIRIRVMFIQKWGLIHPQQVSFPLWQNSHLEALMVKQTGEAAVVLQETLLVP